MSELNFEIRVILRHYWKQGYKATEAARKICDVEGDGTVEIRAAQIWFKKFKNGDTSLEDKPHCGRPFSINPEAVREAVEADPVTSTRRLLAELGTSQPIIVCHLQRIGKVSKSCRE